MSQVQELEDAVRPLLRPTEELKNVLQTQTDRIQEASGDDYSNSVSEALVKRRLLAVVSHRDEEEGYEQGCLLIYKFKSGLFLKGDLTVQQALPINRTFSLAMAQTRHSTIDLRPSESHSALSQSRTEFSLSVTAGDGKEPLTLITHDIQGLKALLGECKRLKAEAEQREASTAPNTYSWVQYYTTKHVPVSLLSTIPPDLRIINRPLHTRLSPASAGLPGDDVADVELVREEWILRKAEELCSKDKHVQQTRLRLRIGTFNVNGKLPSQDLSPWVRGVSNSDSPLNTLPPLKPVSPLDLGEVSKNSEPVWPDESGRHFSTDSRRAEEASVEESETDPDLLVFGFQELDLSTEALLYSSKTSRVDAWTTAILASLGEKGALYHKLASKQLVGMLLIVICKTRLKDSFRDVKVCAVGAGILGIMGNKGGTAIRVTYEPRASPEASPSRAITVTFVDAHLAAFDEMMERRNADFHDLSKRLVFDVVPLSSDASLVNNLPTTIYDSDVLFWMVNLNYRIDLSDSDIRTLLKSEPKDRNIESLLAFDQLRYSMRTGKSFQGFTEHEITRLPAGLLADDLGYDMK
ncbi:DNase I-like protein [Gloeophyllum trabeum ATCC 11539]|uniref:DNase I-like protein n=1 Tax=Gloeophyllum trabeum (strain ATCC 11539 / FP-39264 / Madison 617) TaxID=670483 RepID=S7PTQ4_GLOTA|nr:DNase I-like protein [Gloeophyllum trabeum ATCC 11539]EPQ50828.1 DNase I-like protein [Gloeophyllum trabeum ATCC 11539]